jgi:RHS repeat-associated protein
VFAASSGTAPNSFGFDGGYNAQGGLVLFGTRYYDPAIGMWTQPDPKAQSLATDPTQSDGYSYTGDDPINNVDPTGEVTWRQARAILHTVCVIVGSTAHVCADPAKGTVKEAMTAIDEAESIGEDGFALTKGRYTYKFRLSNLGEGETRK